MWTPSLSRNIDAVTPVGDVVARLGLKEPQEPGLVTVAGLVLSKLDQVPQPGARVSYDGWDFENLEVDGTRMKRLVAFAKGQDQLARCLDLELTNVSAQSDENSRPTSWSNSTPLS
jgi:Mg2+/Co2+ transporter CorB